MLATPLSQIRDPDALLRFEKSRLGVVSRTGVTGLTLGGGVGWLVRKYGLSCDNLLSCEVVTAGGEVVTANSEINPDLFWALRGGGGNFGIVTSLQFRAHPVSMVLGGLILHSRDQAGAVIRNYRSVMASAPEELTVYAGLLSTPDGMPVVGMIACYCGDLAEGERVLKPLRSFGSPLVDAIQPMPFPAMQRLIDGAFPDGNQNYWKSAFLKELSDEAIDLMIGHANRAHSPLTTVVIEFYGGAPGRVGHADTAFAQRQSEYNVGILSQWTNAAESERHVLWARELSDALQPHSSGGYLLNFGSEESQDAIKTAFGSNHRRLAELKAKFDPNNFFSLTQNVLPAS